jgi:acetyltransferase-like isoleucine patch superfamily enzyme
MQGEQMALKRPTSFLGKAFWVLRYRPAHVAGTIRGLVLFYGAAILRGMFPLKGVTLGTNVRLQKNRSVMAEAPEARITVGDDSIVYENAEIEAYGKGNISIGRQSILGYIKIVSRRQIQIGKRFLSSWNVFIQDFDPHPTSASLRALQVTDMVQNFRPRLSPLKGPLVAQEWQSKGWNFPGEPIVIGDDVWVGAGATILKGARIGNGCIIAASAVVLAGDYPPNSLIAGNPAKAIKTLS